MQFCSELTKYFKNQNIYGSFSFFLGYILFTGFKYRNSTMPLMKCAFIHKSGRIVFSVSMAFIVCTCHLTAQKQNTVNKYTMKLLHHINFLRVNILPFCASHMLYNRNNVMEKLPFTHRFIIISSTLLKGFLYLSFSIKKYQNILSLKQATRIITMSTHSSTQSTETIFTPISRAFLHVVKRPSLKTTWVTCLFKVFETCRNTQRAHI